MDSITELKRQRLIRGHVSFYQSLSNARSACYEHSVKPSRIVMGDCPWYWVVSPADAERLTKAGYELIP